MRLPRFSGMAREDTQVLCLILAPTPARGVPLCNRGMEEGVRALLSVANRDGVASLANELRSLGVELFATAGTREALAAEGVGAGSIDELTGDAPLLGGRVRTFHPKIYAGILAHRNEADEL